MERIFDAPETLYPIFDFSSIYFFVPVIKVLCIRISVTTLTGNHAFVSPASLLKQELNMKCYA